MPHSERRRGIALMVVAVAVFAVMDLCLKFLSAQLPPLEVATLRSAASLPFVLASVGVRGRWQALKIRRVGLHILRGLLSVVMIATFSFAIGRMSISGVYTIYMVAPLLVTAVAVPALGERVRMDAWIAIIVGFLGVLAVLRPGANGPLNFLGSLATLASATCYALNYVLARQIARTDSSESLVFWVLLLMAVFSAALGFAGWQPVPASLWPAIAIIGVTGAIAQVCITRAFLMAPASVIAPFEYTALLWGGLFDWFIWGVRPTLVMLFGAALIVGSGIYVMIANTATSAAEKLSAESEPHP